MTSFLIILHLAGGFSSHASVWVTGLPQKKLGTCRKSISQGQLSTGRRASQASLDAPLHFSLWEALVPKSMVINLKLELPYQLAQSGQIFRAFQVWLPFSFMCKAEKCCHIGSREARSHTEA